MTLEIIIFNVGAGQTILIYPPDQPDHAMLIDCGGNENSEGIISFLEKKLPRYALAGNCLRPYLGCLAITHFDHDHFSSLPELQKKIDVGHVLLPQNLTAQELIEHKSEYTLALHSICNLLTTYIYPSNSFAPPYNLFSDHLFTSDFAGEIKTNNLGQVIFIHHGNSTICFPGDLEKTAWGKLLQKREIIDRLLKTDVLIAPHHGRENGYHSEIFSYCSPETIIISDKEIMYDTQDGMSLKYAQHVKEIGIDFKGVRRKVLTTRNEGHLQLSFSINGSRKYGSSLQTLWI